MRPLGPDSVWTHITGYSYSVQTSPVKRTSCRGSRLHLYGPCRAEPWSETCWRCQSYWSAGRTLDWASGSFDSWEIRSDKEKPQREKELKSSQVTISWRLEQTLTINTSAVWSAQNQCYMLQLLMLHACI